jgi:hypothetical protein
MSIQDFTFYYLIIGLFIGDILQTILYYKKVTYFEYRKPNFENLVYGLVIWPIDIYDHIIHIFLICKLKIQIRKLKKELKSLQTKLEISRDKLIELRDLLIKIDNEDKDQL